MAITLPEIDDRLGVAVSLINRNRHKDAARVLLEVRDQIAAAEADLGPVEPEPEPTPEPEPVEAPVVEPVESPDAGAPKDGEGKPAPKRTRQTKAPKADPTA